MNPVYSLKFADGTAWSLTSDDATALWLADVAGILSLPNVAEPQDEASWSFSFQSIPPQIIPVDSIQWTMYGVNYYLHEAGQEVVAVIPEGLEGEQRIYSMWSAVQPLYRHATLHGGGPLHAALVTRNGVGVLVAAPGGTGKSTTFHRFAEPWERVTDDELLAVRTESGVVVHPFPTWSRFLLNPGDHRWKIQQSHPLGACFFLKQGEEVEVDRLGQSEAAVLLHQSMRQILRRGWLAAGAVQEKRLKLAAFESSAELAKAIPCWNLTLPLEGEFIDRIEEVLVETGVLNG